MKTGTKRRNITVIITLSILLLLILNSCDALMSGNEEIRPTCESMIEAMIANDSEAAFALCPMFNKDEFVPYFEECAVSFEGVSSYEIKQVGWYVGVKNGVATRDATYEITTDTGKTCYLYLQTREDVTGIAYVYFVDSTEFIQKTENLWIANIFFILFTVACCAFIVWMIVDCARRAVKMKILWIVLMLLWLTFTVTVGGGIDFNWGFFWPLTWSWISAMAYDRTISVKLVLPIGAFVYFFIRKKYKLKKELEREAELAAAAAAEAEATEVGYVPETDAKEKPDTPDTAEVDKTPDDGE